MKASRVIFCIVLIVTLFNFLSGGPIEKPARSSSIFDIPDQEFYYGFVVNNSSHFVELGIISTKDKRQICSKVVLPPSISSIKKDIRYLRYRKKNEYAYRPPHVMPLWLKFGCYKVSIRYRDDLIDEGQPGQWKSLVVVLDKEYLEESPGPFTLEIEDDHYER